MLHDLGIAAVEGFASGLAIWALIAALCSAARLAIETGTPPRAPESMPAAEPRRPIPARAPQRVRHAATSDAVHPRRRAA